MRKGTLVLAITFLSVVIFAGLAFALFHGVFDHGNFQVVKEEWFSAKQLAIVARRSDHEALSGDQYFVLVGRDTFSTRDLKNAYYGHNVVFRAGSSCLGIHWESAHHLQITCPDHSIQPDEIAVQLNQVEDVSVSYEGIPARH